MTAVRIPKPQGQAAAINARLSVRLVTADGQPVLAFKGFDLLGDYADLALTADLTLELTPTAQLALPDGAATYYQIILRTPGRVERYQVQVPESPASVELADLVAASAIPPAEILAEILAPYLVAREEVKAAAAAAAEDAQATAGDRVQTGLDAQATAADRVQTGLDVIATAGDRVQTGIDAQATAGDRVQTGLDAQATAADRVQTGLDVIATAGDRVQTGLDAQATAADRVQTGLDAQATAEDRVQTGLDAQATAEDRVQTGLDRVQTGLDAAATADDRVQTGQDAAATAGDQAGIATQKASDASGFATTAQIQAGLAADSAASASQSYQSILSLTAHGNVPVPILTGPALSIPAGSALELTIADYDSYATYSVAAGTGAASLDGDTITYIGAATGSDTLTVTVNDHSRVLTITVLTNNLIEAPDAPPSIGAALEGGFYTGAIWDKVCAATGELTIGTGEKTLTIPAGVLPFYYGQQVRVAPGPTNAGQVFMEGTVITRDDTALTLDITSVTGSGTFSAWVVAARWKIILAPKASGENASVQYKNANTAAPTECFTLTNGPEATAAMIAADTSTVYPLAHWAAGLNAGEGLAGYTDWYIPARDELELVWRNLKPVTDNNYTTADRYNAAAYTRDANLDDVAITHGANRNSDPAGDAYAASVPAQTAAAAFQSGGAEAMTFGSVYYWSSSEASATHAWRQNYFTSNPGSQNHTSKTNDYRARAVRRSIL